MGMMECETKRVHGIRFCTYSFVCRVSKFKCINENPHEEGILFYPPKLLRFNFITVIQPSNQNYQTPTLHRIDLGS